MNGRELAERMQIPVYKARALLQNGTIRAAKSGREWRVNIKDLQNFTKKNARKIKDLKAEYVRLYWQGLTIEQLQRRVKGDFEKNGIICTVQGFAEITIYESLMQDKARGGA